MKTGIFYGSTTGDCERIAKSLAAKLGADLHNVSELSDAALQAYDLILLGSSTWGYGDLQDDWEGAISKLSGAIWLARRWQFLAVATLPLMPIPIAMLSVSSTMPLLRRAQLWLVEAFLPMDTISATRLLFATALLSDLLSTK